MPWRSISRWLQWLIGRSLSDGFSQVIAITAQSARGCMSQARPSAAHRRAAPTRIGRQASRLPLSASDSSCHGAADSTPVLLSESSLAQTTFVPSRTAESQLPLGGTRELLVTGAPVPVFGVLVTRLSCSAG